MSPKAVQDEGLQVELAAKAKGEKEAKAPTKVVDIAQAGSGMQVAYNPLSSNAGFADVPEIEGLTPGTPGIPGSGATTGQATDLLSFAKQFVGVKYAWGKSSPLQGFDCSGFTQYVFKKFGIDLPRISYQQGQGGAAVRAQDARPGDLIFWDNSDRNPGADHVGIYLGNGMLISAPKPGDHVKIQAVYGNPFFRRYL
jgi:cell wall-associated NlpC family hydrolase